MYLEISACSRVLPSLPLPLSPFAVTVSTLLLGAISSTLSLDPDRPSPSSFPRLRRLLARFFSFPRSSFFPYLPVVLFSSSSSSSSFSSSFLHFLLLAFLFSRFFFPFYYLLSSEDEPPRHRGKEKRGAGDWIVSSIYTTFGFQFSFFRNRGASPSLGHAPSVPPLFQKVLEFRERPRISRASTTRRWITKRRYNDQGLREETFDKVKLTVHDISSYYLSFTSLTQAKQFFFFFFSLYAFPFLFPVFFFPSSFFLTHPFRIFSSISAKFPRVSRKEELRFRK